MRIYDSETYHQDVYDDKVRVYGEGLFHGNVTCDKMTVPGSAKVGGNVECRHKLGAAGSLIINGDAVTKDKLSVPGKLIVNGNLSYVRSFRLFGELKVVGNIRAYDDLSVVGRLDCNGSIVTDGNVRAHSKINVNGSIMSRRDVDLTSGHSVIQGDVYGYNVEISGNTEIFGKIYYVNSVSTNKISPADPRPEKISPEDLSYMIDAAETVQKPQKIPQAQTPSINMEKNGMLSQQVEKQNYCPYCGAKISSTTKFCAGCGMEV